MKNVMIYTFLILIQPRVTSSMDFTPGYYLSAPTALTQYHPGTYTQQPLLKKNTWPVREIFFYNWIKIFGQ